MKFLKWLLYITGGIFLLILLIALFMPSEYEIEREVKVERPPEAVYKKVAELEEWRKWNPWSQGSDTNLYHGGSGKGSVWEWRSEEHGSGKLRILEAEPYKRIRTEIQFVDSTMTGNGEWRFERSGSNTEVTWRTWGELGYPMGRLLSPFFDDMIGEDLQKGLENLKRHCEEDVTLNARLLRPAQGM